MTHTNTKYLLQIEDGLGRELEDAELRQVQTIDDLSDAQLAVFAALAKRDRITPNLYLRYVVPGTSFTQVLELTSNIEQVLASRKSRVEPLSALANQHLFENTLGRQLDPEERERASSLVQLSDAHTKVAEALAANDPLLATLYISAVVPTATTQDCERLVLRLPKLH